MKQLVYRLFGLMLRGVAASLLAAAAVAEPPREPLRDPTRPPATSTMPRTSIPVTEEQVQFALQSVLVSDLRRRAMINDRLVRVGDRLAGMLVVDITSDGVVLQKNSETLTLSLPKQRIKRQRPQAAAPETGRGKDS